MEAVNWDAATESRPPAVKTEPRALDDPDADRHSHTGPAVPDTVGDPADPLGLVPDERALLLLRVLHLRERPVRKPRRRQLRRTYGGGWGGR